MALAFPVLFSSGCNKCKDCIITEVHKVNGVTIDSLVKEPEEYCSESLEQMEENPLTIVVDSLGGQQTTFIEEVKCD